MKRVVTVAVLLGTLIAQGHAEPVFMPQAASVLKQKQLEVGVSAQAGYQKSEIEGNPGTTFINRVWHFPIWARYGITDTIESRVSIPITHAIDSSEGNASTHNESTGLGNIQLGSKWNFLSGNWPLAFGLDFDLPTANPRNNEAALGWRYSNQVQQGFNTHLYMVNDSPLWADLMRARTMFGYMNAGEYTTSGGVKFNPSDLVTFGATLDFDMKRWVQGLSASAEMVGNSAINHSKTDGVENGSDKGTVIEAGPGVRYQTGRWRTHAGLLLNEGKTTFRAYRFRVLFGASYLFGGVQ